MPKITMEAARRNAKLTQEQMAKMLGISRSYYNNMENGTVEIKPVYVLGFCQITGFKTDDIILPERSTNENFQQGRRTMRPMEKLFAGGPKRDSLRIIGTLVGVSPAAIAGYAKDKEKLKSARARTLALLIQRARLTPEETAEVIAELAK